MTIWMFVMTTGLREHSTYGATLVVAREVVDIAALLNDCLCQFWPHVLEKEIAFVGNYMEIWTDSGLLVCFSVFRILISVVKAA